MSKLIEEVFGVFKTDFRHGEGFESIRQLFVER